MHVKKWYASKVIWVNLVALVVAGVQAWAGQASMDPALAAGILAAANAALRLFTDKPIG